MSFFVFSQRHLGGLRLRPITLALCAALPVVAPARADIQELPTLGGWYAKAMAVSADGLVVAGDSTLTHDNGSYVHAFAWTQATGMRDLGTLQDGKFSYAYGISGDGSVVVGYSHTTDDGVNSLRRAFRWTSAGGMEDLGVLTGSYSSAEGVSADGNTVVGWSGNMGSGHAFRWTRATGMVDLGTLGGTASGAVAASADGSVIVGSSGTPAFGPQVAFIWTQNTGMLSLGTLAGGTGSSSSGISADGSVVVGVSDIVGGADHAFRWTQGNGMVDIGTLGGTNSLAYGVSADGKVVVGRSDTTNDADWRAFRWTQATGMQSVEDWLRAGGVSVPSDITMQAFATNSDGSVVVGETTDRLAFVARSGSGLITLRDLYQSLSATAASGSMALTSASLLINGAHSRPLSRRVAEGKSTFWLAGDLGRDDHGARSGDLGLAEMGYGKNFGPVQLNVALGQTWSTQKQVLDGRAESDATYFLLEGLAPLSGNLWATVGAYAQFGQADIRRGYLNAGLQNYSTGKADADAWGLRARLEWAGAWQVAKTDISPYLDVSYGQARLASYTETTGGFPAFFNARKENATELRAGVNGSRPLENGLNVVGVVEAAHRFEKQGSRSSGYVIGLPGSDFDLPGQRYNQDWVRAGIGLEGKLADGRLSLMLNATTKGETANYWLAASWQKSF